MKETKIHNYNISYEDDKRSLEEGARYLQGLDDKEVRTLCEAAKRDTRHNLAYFEDKYKTNFELKYLGRDKYELRKRTY